MEIEPQPPLPPTSTHPLFKSPIAQQPPAQPPTTNLNYSTSEAPKVGYYPNPLHLQQQQKNPSGNPWEREEREKENEMRREHMRQWRDQQIVELSLVPSRSPQQEEQLKTLVLERDFERRAQEEENEEENDAQYQKNAAGVQEVLRLTNPSQITAPTTRLKQVDIKTTPTNISPTNENSHLHPPPIQPKSILKSTNAYSSNPSSPSKHGKVTSFAKTQNLSEITINNTNANQMMTQLNKEISELTLEYQQEETNGPMPPPPPERGSSFAAMHQQKARNFSQKIAFNDHSNVNNNNNIIEQPPMMMSPTPVAFNAHQNLIQQQMNIINNNNNSSFIRDNKRVSFHDHENNNVEILMDDHDGSQIPGSIIREDPNVSLKKKNYKIYFYISI